MIRRRLFSCAVFFVGVSLYSADMVKEGIDKKQLIDSLVTWHRNAQERKVEWDTLQSKSSAIPIGDFLVNLVSLYHEVALVSEIGVNNCEIGDDFVNQLMPVLKKPQFSQLNYLNLSKNNITDKGAGILAEFMASNASIKILALDNNHIGPEGFKALLDALQYNITLEHIYLKSSFNKPSLTKTKIYSLVDRNKKRNEEVASGRTKRTKRQQAALEGKNWRDNPKEYLKEMSSDELANLLLAVLPARDAQEECPHIRLHNIPFCRMPPELQDLLVREYTFDQEKIEDDRQEASLECNLM